MNELKEITLHFSNLSETLLYLPTYELRKPNAFIVKLELTSAAI